VSIIAHLSSKGTHQRRLRCNWLESLALIIHFVLRLHLRNTDSNDCASRAWINWLSSVVFVFFLSSLKDTIIILIILFFCVRFNICKFISCTFFGYKDVDFIDPLRKLLSADVRHLRLIYVKVPKTFVIKVENVWIKSKCFLVFLNQL
jgi:hypothetical protein